MEKAMIISRCSTDETRQDVSRQTKELQSKYSNTYEIVRVYEYYKSGRKNDDDLTDILNYAVLNEVQHLLFHEVSRISRTVISTLVFLRTCTEKRINVIIDNYNMHTLNIDKSENVMTKTMLQLGASFSEMEIRQTYSRLASGRLKHIAAGGKIGRNKGTFDSKEDTLQKHKDIAKCLKQGFSVRKTMKLTDKSNGTVQKVKQLLAA